MKDQYFGDENDYRKYGLLRILMDCRNLRTGICWMLTKPDGCSDGGRIQYLTKPMKWRKYDPVLFDALQKIVLIDQNRKVIKADTPSILRPLKLYNSYITDNIDERQKYFSEVIQRFNGLDMIFFDPDNGIEIPSIPKGRKNSCKYIYWSELEVAFTTGFTIMVYQHFRRENRKAFIEKQVHELRENLSIDKVHVYRTSHVVFYLIPQLRHRKYFGERLSFVNTKWEGQIHGEIPA